MSKIYNGQRVGENVGLIESHVNNVDIPELMSEKSNINFLSKNIQTSKPGTVTVFSKLLPAKIFKTSRIDGVGTWQHSIVKGNGMTLTQQGKRYANELIPQDTYVNLPKSKKSDYYSTSIAALAKDEVVQAILTLKASLESVEKTDLSGGNLKQKIFNEIAKMERKTGIPKSYYTLTLSNDAVNDLRSYEIGDVDYLSTTRDGSKNYFGVRELYVGEVDELPSDIYFMIHIPEYLGVVRYTQITKPGFYAISSVDNSPSLIRFVIEDGYSMDYYDGQAGVIVTQDAYDEEQPRIHFTKPTIEVAVGTTVDTQYLIDNNGLTVYDSTFEGGKYTEVDESVLLTNTTLSEIDTAAEGIAAMTVDFVDESGNAAVQRTIVVKISTSVVAPTKMTSDKEKELLDRITALTEENKGLEKLLESDETE